MHTRAVKCNPKLTHFRNVSLETEGKNQKQEYENGKKKKQKTKKKTESQITEKKTIKTSNLGPKVKNKTETECKPNQ